MTTSERIRRIFIERESGYTLSAAATLLEYTEEQIIRSVEQGDLALESFGDLPRIPWHELALAAAERWPQEVIEAALGADVESTIPEMVRLTELHVRLPRFGALVADRVAQRDGTTLNHLIARQVLDLAILEGEAFESSLPGLAVAMRWPLP